MRDAVRLTDAETFGGWVIKIARLSWVNFRSLLDGHATVRDHLVLVGPNASGKSSVLAVAALTLGSGADLPSIRVQDFRDPTLTLELEATLVGLDDDDRGAFPDEVVVAEGAASLRISVRAEVDPTDPETTLTVTRSFPDSGHGRRPSSAQLKRLGFSKISASRSMGRELVGAQGVARSLVRGLDITADAAALEAGLAQVRTVLETSTTIGDFRDILAARLTESLPATVGKDDVKLTLSSDLADSPLAATTMTLRDAGGDRPLTEHSDGVQALTVLALMGMGSATSARIVAIDEPETHLHPTAQRALIERLLAGTSQQLLATHSSAVAAAAKPEHLATIDRTGMIRQLPDDAPISGALQLLRDYRQSLVEPLTARVVCVVEGDADRMLLEAVARSVNIPLSRLDVAIFQLDGCGGFASVWNFFGPAGLGMTFTAVCDEDAREDWAGTLGVDPGALKTRDVLVLTPDLEGVYVAELGHARVLELIQAAGLISERWFCAQVGKSKWAEVNTHEDVLKVCGAKKLKTAAAASIAAGMTEADGRKLTTIATYLSGLVP